MARWCEAEFFFPARWKNCLVFQELFPGFEAAKSPERLKNVLILSEVIGDDQVMGQKAEL